MVSSSKPPSSQPAARPPLSDAESRLLDAYWRAATVHSPGYVAETDAEAREELWRYFKEGRDRIGASRGWPPVTRTQFDQELSPNGSLYVGSPETVATKIAGR